MSPAGQGCPPELPSAVLSPGCVPGWKIPFLSVSGGFGASNRKPDTGLVLLMCFYNHSKACVGRDLRDHPVALRIILLESCTLVTLKLPGCRLGHGRTQSSKNQIKKKILDWFFQCKFWHNICPSGLVTLFETGNMNHLSHAACAAL